jgi:hypothetical protein
MAALGPEVAMVSDLRRLGDQVVVLAGALSGMGVMSARQAAASAAPLILAARDADPLAPSRSYIGGPLAIATLALRSMSDVLVTTHSRGAAASVTAVSDVLAKLPSRRSASGSRPSGSVGAVGSDRSATDGVAGSTDGRQG